MIKLKSLLKEGKVGSIYNMKKQMEDGSFKADNPEVLIRGFGRLPLKDLEKKVNRDLTDLAKRAAKGGESNFKGILNLLTKNDYVVDQAQAVVDVYEELKSSQVKKWLSKKVNIYGLYKHEYYNEKEDFQFKVGLGIKLWLN